MIVVAIILGLITVGLCIGARYASVFPGDLSITAAFQSLSSGTLTGVFKVITWPFGDWHLILLGLPAGLLVGWRFGRRAGLAVWATCPITAFNYIFKAAVDRPRPSAAQAKLLIDESGAGFPSGHAFFTLIFLGFLAYLLCTRLKNRTARVVSVVLFTLLILAVGASRVYLGVHWTSDVIGGYAAGGFFLVILIWGYRTIPFRR